ncbi:hypothetical protein GOFOIKOB_5485 [Methylobacterium tardum]|uniref:Uncharacterized protein n=1 Tax=Methylobacterium tardum TaxID=374432 RepID=A0AA37TBT4_9HYPH|nr:hypothetical protein [Methylobacterium tardum]URD36034.1 hypothetical protein M6G65_26980 [Methylobacterium tardum]GJE52414.1 hypothetical protein GOFOIKOB_5485 [Methylobacterium tardum]GLS69030.1 hypothetical protein GCM10007890_10420 [Methylobacterium tardum]
MRTERLKNRLGGLPAEVRDQNFALLARSTVSGLSQAITEAAKTDQVAYVSVALPNGTTAATAVDITEKSASSMKGIYKKLGTLPAVTAFIDSEVTSRVAASAHFPAATRAQLILGSGKRQNIASAVELDTESSSIRVSRGANEGVATVRLWLENDLLLSVVIASGATVELTPTATTISCTLATGVPIVDDMMRFRAAGQVREVAVILDSMSGKEVLRYLGNHPAASMLLGYGLLRSGDIAQMFGPFARAAKLRPDISDAAVLAGEAAARLGLHSDALAFFSAAAKAGLPAFSFGVNYLVDRLRTYGPRPGGPFSDEAALNLANKALAQVQPFAPAMLHGAIATTYRMER